MSDDRQYLVRLAEDVAAAIEEARPIPQREYTISEVAKEIGRVSHTIRVWGYNNRLPEHLRPRINQRGWRVWTRDQIEGIKEWIVTEDMNPGKAFRRKAQ